MKTSESIKEIAAALAKARKTFHPVVKDKVAHVKSDKGSYSFAYADLSSVIDAVKDALSDNGIAVIQAASASDGAVTVETRLVHLSGEWIESAITMRADGGKPQNVGSAITYARRYGLSGMVGISSEEDDDANAAQGNQRTVTERKSKDAAEAVRAAAAKAPNGSARRVPQTPEERRKDLRERMDKLGIPGAKQAEQVGEWIGRPVDSKTVLTADDWTRADAGLEQARANGEVLAKARGNVESAFNDPKH